MAPNYLLLTYRSIDPMPACLSPRAAIGWWHGQSVCLALYVFIFSTLGEMAAAARDSLLGLGRAMSHKKDALWPA